MEDFYNISEHEPRKGTETATPQLPSKLKRKISEHEPRKGTETTLQGQ